MTKHSKNNTASSVFSYHEYKRLNYGTQRQRLGHESMREYDACSLCLQKARDPVACNRGHLFCRECVYTDLLSQKKDIKKQKARLEALKKEAAEERARAQSEARERVLKEFERGQLGLGLGGSAVISTSGISRSKEQGTGEKLGEGDDAPEESHTRGTKRKVDVTFSPTSIQRLAEEAEEAALKRIKLEQEESLKAKLPDFWLPSLTPTYTSSGPPKDLKDVRVVTTCKSGTESHEISLKTLIPVRFTYPKELPPGVKENDRRDGMCPSCKKTLSNNHIMYLMEPCSHVACKTCTDTLIRPSLQCVVCDKELSKDAIVELKREGTGYAGGGLAETSKVGVSFQG